MLKDKAQLIARSLAALSPGAVNVGRNDLASGVAFVMEVGEASGLPWLSSNIRLPDGSAPFPTFKRLKWGELKVAIVAATPANLRIDGNIGIKVLDPVKALRQALAEAGEADVVIALSDLGYNEEHALARALPQLNIIIGGGSGNRMIKDPLKLGKTLLLRVADRGRHLGVFDLTFSRPLNWGTPTSAAAATGGSGALEAFGQKLARVRSSTAPEDDPVLRTIALLKKKAADKKPPPVGVRYTNRVIFLNRSVAGDPTVTRDIAAFKAKRRTAMPALPTPRAKAAPKKNVPVTSSSPPQMAKAAPKKNAPVASSPPVQKAAVSAKAHLKTVAAPARASAKKAAPKKTSWYLGTRRCRSCHQPQYTKWIVTGHSRSGSLVPIDKMADPKCRSCHTAKLSLKKGTSSEGFVGCESCHGQGSGHPEQMKGKGEKVGKVGKPKIVREVAPKICLGCHRGEHQEIFVLEQDYQKIRCDR